MPEKTASMQVPIPPVVSNGVGQDHRAVAETAAPDQDVSASTSPKTRKPLKDIAVKKPQLTAEAKPSARVYLGPPDGGKFFRVLFVDGLSYRLETDDADIPLVEFVEYFVVTYES